MPIEFDPAQPERSFFETVKSEAVRLFQNDELRLSHLHHILREDNEIGDLLHATSIVALSSENFLFLRAILRLQGNAPFTQEELIATLTIICKTEFNLQKDQLLLFNAVVEQLAACLTELTAVGDLEEAQQQRILRTIREIINRSADTINKIINEISTLVLRNQVQPIKNLLQTDKLIAELEQRNAYTTAKRAYEKSQKHWYVTEKIKEANSGVLKLFSDELSRELLKEPQSNKYITYKAIITECLAYQKHNQWINLDGAIVTAKSKIVEEGKRKAFDAGLKEIDKQEGLIVKTPSLRAKIEDLIAKAREELDEPKPLRPRKDSRGTPSPSGDPILPYRVVARRSRSASRLSSSWPKGSAEFEAIIEEAESAENEGKKEKKKEGKEKDSSGSRRSSFRFTPPT